jgi:hypothetical protein
MTKSKSNGYKLAKRFMNSKDIFKLLKRLSSVGYAYTIEPTPENINSYQDGYTQFIKLKYIGNDNKVVLPLYIYFKDRQENDNFKQDIQVTYHY